MKYLLYTFFKTFQDISFQIMTIHKLSLHSATYGINQYTNQFLKSQAQLRPIWIKPEKKLMVITIFTFDLQLKQIIIKLSFLCMNSIQEPMMYTWHQCHIYLSWSRCLEITEQYNNKLFIDFNKYSMVLGSNRYLTHRQFSLYATNFWFGHV